MFGALVDNTKTEYASVACFRRRGPYSLYRKAAVVIRGLICLCMLSLAKHDEQSENRRD